MEAQIVITVRGENAEDLGRRIEAVQSLIREVPHPVEPAPGPAAPSTPRKPFFALGEGEGKAGDEVIISMLGGCLQPVDGFAVAGGLGHILDAVKVELGSYLIHHLGDRRTEVFSVFRKGHPEPYWSYFVGFFKLDAPIPDATKVTEPPMAIPIPYGTELFRVHYRIPAGISPQELTLYCADRWFYPSPQMSGVKLDVTYTAPPKGYTDVSCISGKLIVR